MRKIALWAVSATLVLAGTLFVSRHALPTASAATCSETIVCPLSGEKVCKADCPLFDATRPDCPGRINCPLSGQLVCRDRCPLQAEASEGVPAPACCRRPCAY